MKRFKTDFGENIVLGENGYYYFRSGKTFISLRTKDPDKVKEQSEVIQAEIDRHGHMAFVAPVKTFADIYLKQQKKRLNPSESEARSIRKIRPATYCEMELTFRVHLTPFFGKRKLKEIDSDLWAEYCEQVKTVSDLTNHRKVFGAFLKWCKKKKHISALPDITDIPVHKSRKRRILKEQDMVNIFSQAKESFLLFLSFALFMGLRRGEIIKMRWEHIDFSFSALHIPESNVKTGEARDVPVNGFVLKQLKKRFDEFKSDKRLRKSDWVFPNKRDVRRHMSVDGFMKPWKRLLKRAGLPEDSFTWHDLRATYEKFLNKDTRFTDTQREKMAGASIEVQKRRYVTFDADDLRGTEEVVSVPALQSLFNNAEKQDNGIDANEAQKEDSIS